MEHTGLYNLPILKHFQKKDAIVWMESAIHIKRTSGIVRGKTDKIDAERIANYANKNIEHIKVWKPKRKEVEAIKTLLTLRDNLINNIKQICTYINEYKAYGDKEIAKMLISQTRKSINVLKKEVENIEDKIKQIIEEDKTLNNLYNIITSIPGIGKVTAWIFISHTNEFKMFTNPRSLACHSGIAPFENSSGLMRGNSKVSHLANKRLKTALHMASMTAVKADPELKIYYERKVAEGKNKMSVLNAVRNKLVHRMYSCQKNNKIYEKKVA